MADKDTEVEPKFDVDGNPILDNGEGAGKAPKIVSKTPDDEDADPEIPVRKSALQHIIARKNRTIDKLRSKDEEDDEDGFGAPKGGEDDEDDSLTPAARGAVQKEVAKALGPVVKSLASKADDDELLELFDQEPESRQYAKRIRSYMESSHYKGVPPSVIFHHLAFDNAANAGLRKKKAADMDAGQSRNGGRSSRPSESATGDIPSADDQNDMSEADFEALQNRVRSGEFVKRRDD